jgi:hypothetical protein
MLLNLNINKKLLIFVIIIISITPYVCFLILYNTVDVGNLFLERKVYLLHLEQINFGIGLLQTIYRE